MDVQLRFVMEAIESNYNADRPYQKATEYQMCPVLLCTSLNYIAKHLSRNTVCHQILQTDKEEGD